MKISRFVEACSLKFLTRIVVKGCNDFGGTDGHLVLIQVPDAGDDGAPARALVPAAPPAVGRREARVDGDVPPGRGLPAAAAPRRVRAAPAPPAPDAGRAAGLAGRSVRSVSVASRDVPPRNGFSRSILGAHHRPSQDPAAVDRYAQQERCFFWVVAYLGASGFFRLTRARSPKLIERLLFWAIKTISR